MCACFVSTVSFICWAVFMSRFWQGQNCFIVLYFYCTVIPYTLLFHCSRIIVFYRYRDQTGLLISSFHTTHYKLLRICVSFTSDPPHYYFRLVATFESTAISTATRQGYKRPLSILEVKQNNSLTFYDSVKVERWKKFTSDWIIPSGQYRSGLHVHFRVSWAFKSTVTVA